MNDTRTETVEGAVRNLLTPEQWAEVHKCLAFVPETLLEELRKEPPHSDIPGMATDFVVNKTTQALRLFGSSLKNTVSETETCMSGVHLSEWRDLKRGFLVELCERYRGTEKFWKTKFAISPLAETAHGRAQFEAEALAHIETVADAAAESARLAGEASRSSRQTSIVAIVSAVMAVIAAGAAVVQAYYAKR